MSNGLQESGSTGIHGTIRDGDEGGGGDDQAERKGRVGRCVTPSVAGDAVSFHRAQRKGAVGFLCGVAPHLVCAVGTREW